jgi:NAD(P)-dependent dehydrogenase (short-subunit alcohol dehydrogenase family)
VAGPSPSLTLRGKVCLVTGANRGIGRATAAGLARLGADVLLVARDRAAGEAAAADIGREAGNDAVELLLADLSSQRSIRELARAVLERRPRLDVLVNNAAVATRERTTTVDGIETQFAVNHLAYFLLTNLLVNRLRASAPARVVNVSSDAHHGHRLDFDDLELRRGYGGMEQYSRTKLANLLFTYELARRLRGTGVTANALHPGVIATRLLLDSLPLPGVSTPVMSALGGTPEQGADTVIWLASSPEVEGVTGKYFIRRREARSSSASYDQTAARRLWLESERLTGLTPAAAR